MFRPVSSKVSFPQLEENILRLWKERDIFRKSIDQRPQDRLFTFYEGPPYANASPGIHHVLARVFKDVMVRYKTMRGYRVPRKAGWDTHGLPAELEVERELGFKSKADIESFGIEEFNRRCRQNVFAYLKEWEALTERIAFWLDLGDAYITCTNDYMESCWWAVKQLWDRGLVYQDYRVTPHCPRCGTSLSDHEVAQGYRENTPDPSVWIKFRLTSESEQKLGQKVPGEAPTYFLAWTTTPWTLPGNTALAVDPEAWPGAEWLSYGGRWGEVAVQSDFGGPLGPADKGAQWEQPYAWGMAQPLDTDTWYANRLRVEVVGATAGEAQVRLADERGGELSPVEELGHLAILHSDPLTGTGVVASINVPPNSRWDVVATWPDAAAGQVTRLRFADVPFAEPGRATLELGPGPVASLLVEGAGDGGSDLALEPSGTETFEVTWDAPDLVWIGTVLPAHQVGTGLLIVLLASVVPALVYVGTLYWVDRYEKEPKRLLAATFLWGAIPSLALALAAELFFRLPPDLIGSHALEAVRLGLIAPLLQEVLKGAAVLFISWRYRREFDNVLDGIIYGAMVGFGFAMTGNLLSYVGSFALWGFDGLSASVFTEGLAYGMNHALYTAVFGAGLGFARLAQKRRQRWVLSVGGFVLAVVTHALHSLLARNLLGLNVVTVLATGAGVILVGIVTGWSLARQRRCLITELVSEVPDTLYRTLTAPGRRGRAEWRALWTGGISEWRRARRLHEYCTELAFKKMQHRRRPDESEIVQEIERLRQEITDSPTGTRAHAQ